MQAQQQIKQSIQIAQQYFNRCFTVPDVFWFSRGMNAGYAKLNQNQIYLNQRLYEEHEAYFLTQVIPHEIAHLLTHILYGKVKPHGKEWQSIMQHVFGLEPKVTHQLACKHVSRLSQYQYQCECGEVQLSAIRHNRVQRGQQQYRCKVCLQILAFNAPPPVAN